MRLYVATMSDSDSCEQTNTKPQEIRNEKNMACNRIYYGEDVMNSILEKIDSKQALLSRHWLRYLCRAIMAGVLIGLFVAFSLQVKTDFGADFNNALSSLLAAIAFSMALVFILFTNSELLTSNFMYFTVGQHYRKTRLSNTLKPLGICLAGNIIGCVIIALMMWSADILQDSTIATLAEILHKKTLASGCWKIFINAIFANFFINVAIIISMQLKEDLAKIAALMMGVIVFAYMGYEHVIANIAIYSLALLCSPENCDMLMIGKSLLFSLLGNFVGGGLVIGLFYAYLNDKRELK